ncbi:hypothetical protein CEXT_61881 [Caerostris extrusa]|uniref:Secreted protein n=1 Tax=Caerostris extrusa TaxID=172846 RepID=A0AAV4TW47_CAEEX|nr:hypothetical protein CEXT_61881 [Caerostris extrusa]
MLPRKKIQKGQLAAFIFLQFAVPFRLACLLKCQNSLNQKRDDVYESRTKPSCQLMNFGHLHFSVNG